MTVASMYICLYLINGKTRPLSRSENLKDNKDAIGARETHWWVPYV
jgi:hypothetical protein